MLKKDFKQRQEYLFLDHMQYDRKVSSLHLLLLQNFNEMKRNFTYSLEIYSFPFSYICICDDTLMFSVLY